MIYIKRALSAFIKFNSGLMGMPFHWQLWLLVLVTANGVVPLFFLDRLEGKVIIATLLASMVLMTILTGLTGFTRILGLGHIFWVPLILFLWTRLGQNPASDLFGIWIRALIVVNSMSIVIDAIDVIRYLRGDKAETVNLPG